MGSCLMVTSSNSLNPACCSGSNRFNPSNTKATFDNYLTPVILVFIRKLSLSTHMPGFE